MKKTRVKIYILDKKEKTEKLKEKIKNMEEAIELEFDGSMKNIEAIIIDNVNNKYYLITKDGKIIEIEKELLEYIFNDKTLINKERKKTVIERNREWAIEEIVSILKNWDNKTPKEKREALRRIIEALQIGLLSASEIIKILEEEGIKIPPDVLLAILVAAPIVDKIYNIPEINEKFVIFENDEEKVLITKKPKNKKMIFITKTPEEAKEILEKFRVLDGKKEQELKEETSLTLNF